VAWNGSRTSPNEDTNEQNPRNLRVLNEEPRKVMCFLDPILIASVCHGLIYLRNDFDGFSIRQELGADGNHLLPGLHSHDGNRTLVGRAQLHFAQTRCPFAGAFLRYITANRPGFERYGTMALRGTEGTGGCGTPLRLMDAIIPGFNEPEWSIRSLLR